MRRGLYRLRHFPSSPHEHIVATWLSLHQTPAGVSHESALELYNLSDVIPGPGRAHHKTALDLWDVSDVNPAKSHIAVSRTHRPQQQVPKAYVIHREDLDSDGITAIEGIPVVKLGCALHQCAQAHLARDLLEQTVRHGRSHGLRSAEEHPVLMRELELEGVGGRA